MAYELCSKVVYGRVDPVLTEDCLALAPDTERFARFILERRPQIELNMILRIMAIVRETYEFEYSFVELRKRCISAPVTIIKARGDDYSFIENAHSFSDRPPRVIKVENDHYEILRGEAVRELAQLIAPDADTASNALLFRRVSQRHGPIEVA